MNDVETSILSPPIEQRVLTAVTASHIDLAAFRVYMRALGADAGAALRPVDESDLRSHGVLSEIGGELRATLYGVLAFGKEPQLYPQTASFWVECVAYAGTDRSADVILVGEGKGRLPEQVERALGWVRGLGRFERYGDLMRTDVPLVPQRALREALVNAVVHRDYAITGSKVLLEVFSNRVDVTSPGTLPNRMTVESVRAGGQPRSRNELMASFMVTMGAMEQRGRGWPVIRRDMREHNGTDVELIHDPRSAFVRVRFHLQA